MDPKVRRDPLYWTVRLERRSNSGDVTARQHRFSSRQQALRAYFTGRLAIRPLSGIRRVALQHPVMDLHRLPQQHDFQGSHLNPARWARNRWWSGAAALSEWQEGAGVMESGWKHKYFWAEEADATRHVLCIDITACRAMASVAGYRDDVEMRKVTGYGCRDIRDWPQRLQGVNWLVWRELRANARAWIQTMTVSEVWEAVFASVEDSEEEYG